MSSRRPGLFIVIALFAAGVIMLVAGVGEMSIVEMKAVHICLECIGIG